MITDDNYTPGFAVEPTLLIEYLIEKAEELSTKNYRGFPLSFRGFGIIALDPFPELYKEFLEIVARSDDPINRRAARCKEIFIDALARPQDRESKDEGDERDEDGQEHPFERVLANRFAWAARRDGESMIVRKDFRFLPIFECMSFIAFQGDAERFNKFQEKCAQFTDPEQRIEAVIPLLWEVVRARTRKT